MQVVFRLLFVQLFLPALLISQLTNDNDFYYRNIVYIYKNITKCQDGGNHNKVAIVLHGWQENCNRPWAKDLLDNLKTHRGGCIFCFDYGYFAENIYFILKNQHFEGITTELNNKLRDLHTNAQFNPDNIYMFGFSFGAQIVLEAGRRFAREFGSKIKQIDVCEPTAHGFLTLQPKHREAARNVQCIHTSAAFGTPIRDCHQDWNMGVCGLWQVGGSETSFRHEFGNGSHGLCPSFYNLAFDNKFPAVTKPDLCVCFSGRIAEPRYMTNFSMGYIDALKYLGSFPEGKEFYARTKKTHPFNVVCSPQCSDKN